MCERLKNLSTYKKLYKCDQLNLENSITFTKKKMVHGLCPTHRS